MTLMRLFKQYKKHLFFVRVVLEFREGNCYSIKYYVKWPERVRFTGTSFIIQNLIQETIREKSTFKFRSKCWSTPYVSRKVQVPFHFLRTARLKPFKRNSVQQFNPSRIILIPKYQGDK